jgi:hypothetical protein
MVIPSWERYLQIKKFDQFIKESENRTSWEKMEFETSAEKSVHDVVEETLLTMNLTVICKGDDDFTKLEQMTTTTSSETVLKITGQRLYHYTSPFDFLKWETIGATPEDVLETCFIVPDDNLNKMSKSGKITENSVNQTIGYPSKVVVSGDSVLKNQEAILKAIKQADPQSKGLNSDAPMFYPATGKIVGIMNSTCLRALSVALRKVDPKLIAEIKK